MRFGISETSWMFPKIFRIRLDAVGRVSGAWIALVAMEVFSFRRAPALAGALFFRPGSRRDRIFRCAQTQKAADLQLGKSQLQRPRNPSRSMRGMRGATTHPVPKSCGEGAH